MTSTAKFADFAPMVLKTGHLAAFTSYDAEFIAHAKALGARLFNIEGRKGWYIAAEKAAQWDAFRTICAEAGERAIRKPASKPARYIGGEENYGGDWQRNGRGQWVR